jgi:hypothetical protein
MNTPPPSESASLEPPEDRPVVEVDKTDPISLHDIKCITEILSHTRELRNQYKILIDLILLQRNTSSFDLRSNIKVFKVLVLKLQKNQNLEIYIQYMSRLAIYRINGEYFDYWVQLVKSNTPIIMDKLIHLLILYPCHIADLASICVMSSSLITFEYLVKKGFKADESFIKRVSEYRDMKPNVRFKFLELCRNGSIDNNIYMGGLFDVSPLDE